MKIDWKWDYKRIFGVMFGPPPVGWIVLRVGAALYYGFGD